MSDTRIYSSDVAFTPAVKAIQTKKGSREGYAQVERNGGWRTEIDDKLAHFLAETNSFYMATATADGQPYIQHRGGPKGFVKVLDKHTIAFADYSGNRQFLTQGNLSENPKAHIFIMDYAHRRRVKMWGEARVVDDDPALLQSLMPKGYRARPEQDHLLGPRAVAFRHQRLQQRRIVVDDPRLAPHLDATAMRVIHDEDVRLGILREIALRQILPVAAIIGESDRAFVQHLDEALRSATVLDIGLSIGGCGCHVEA